MDLSATRRRIQRLSRYVGSNLLLNGRFVCQSCSACSRSLRGGDVFRPGIMSHVGRRFDLTIDAKPLRIVVVGQESGWPKTRRSARGAGRISLERRHHDVVVGSGLEHRYYAEDGHPGRNPHMRGTTSLLRLVFGLGLAADHDTEFLQPAGYRAFHIFEGFALVNRLLCSASPPRSSQGHPTPTMVRNCSPHFEATLAILEPTLVVAQGARVSKWTLAHFDNVRSRGEHLHEATFGGRRLLVCTFSHPSAHGDQRWGDRLDAPYLTGVVVPTLRRAVARL